VNGDVPLRFSENPRWVLWETRGGEVRCGEFLYFTEGSRMKVLTNPGGAIPTTSVPEHRKLSPQELCEKYNKLLWENQRLREAS
jgi:hypothetical protein